MKEGTKGIGIIKGAGGGVDNDEGDGDGTLANKSLCTLPNSFSADIADIPSNAYSRSSLVQRLFYFASSAIFIVRYASKSNRESLGSVITISGSKRLASSSVRDGD